LPGRGRVVDPELGEAAIGQLSPRQVRTWRAAVITAERPVATIKELFAPAAAIEPIGR
jgi:hypothetical protein